MSLPPLEDRRLAATCWLASFGSISALLGHVSGLAPFWTLGWAVVLPCTLLMVAVYLRAVQLGHGVLAQTLRVGFWGGVWGTIGYDLVRIPLHLGGMNPFAPIRSYGMYLANASHATVGTDWLGALYHFSNGVSFGIAYALVMRGRSLWFGVLWGVVLELLAVATPYGEVYAIRSAPLVLAIGTFAHVYYGLPLGGAVAEPGRADRIARTWQARSATLLGVVAVLGFLTFAWEGPGTTPQPGQLHAGPDALRSGWTRVELGQPLSVVGHADRPIDIRVGSVELQVPAGAVVEAPLSEPGIVQVVAPNEPWRSAFVSVERGSFPR